MQKEGKEKKIYGSKALKIAVHRFHLKQNSHAFKNIIYLVSEMQSIIQSGFGIPLIDKIIVTRGRLKAKAVEPVHDLRRLCTIRAEEDGQICYHFNH